MLRAWTRTWFRPECKTHVSEEQLSSWSVGLHRAIEVALDNLRGMTRGGLEEAAPGFWVSPWKDDYDDARILLPDLIEQCEVKGSHVARNFSRILGLNDLSSASV